MDTKIHKQGKRYDTEAERYKGYLSTKLRYALKEWKCETCNISIQRGNKVRHLKSKRHNLHLQ
jgi:hypothetical protein